MESGSVECLARRMDSGKVLDVACLSRYCQGCINMEMYKTSDPDRHAGSAPAMEKEGVK